jgi:hypothetical protein
LDSSRVTSLGVDVGTSANNTFLAAESLPPNPKVEVDTNEGPSTLAVALQYEGVANLAGISSSIVPEFNLKQIYQNELFLLLIPFLVNTR